MNKWRTLKIHQLSSLVDDEDYKKIHSLMDSLDIEFKILLEETHKDIDNILTLDCINSAGNFRDYMLKEYEKPYLKWEHITGNKAKYYRIIIEQVRRSLLSLRDKHLISKICSKYDYSETDKRIVEEIQNNGISYSSGIIRNICRSRSAPTFSTDTDFVLDFTCEDNQISTVSYDNERINYSIRICGEWIKLVIPLPKSARYITGRFAKPVIQKDSETQDLILKVSYEVPEMKLTTSKKDTTGVLSCDLGKKKPFSAVITFEDGSYGSELIASKELERLNEKLEKLNTEKNILWKKVKLNNDLLKGKYNSYLYNHVEDQYQQRRLLLQKITSLKEHMEWLIARDITMHAYSHGVNTLKLEDLRWLDSKGGKWSFGSISHKIIEIAELYGITVLYVNARNSSHTDPFTKERVTPGRDRSVKTVISKIDRDYCAALELGTRKGRGVKKSKIVDRNKKDSRSLKPRRTRDKHHSTPKRPKLIRRKSCYKLMHKHNVSLEDFKNTTGTSVAVASSGIVSRNVLCLPLCNSFNNNNTILRSVS